MYGELVEGTFIKRLSRFSGLVELKRGAVVAHIPNSGRLKELLVPGARMVLERIADKGKGAQAPRKTCHDLLLAWHDVAGWVCVDARVANTLVAERLGGEGLCGLGGRTWSWKREVAWGNSRLDFRLDGPGGPFLIEVKSVTLVRDRVAYFPDAPTERGRRHISELIETVRQGQRAAVVFVVQRRDAVSFSPNDETDHRFGESLRRASECGVDVHAFRCEVGLDSIQISESIPVVLSA